MNLILAILFLFINPSDKVKIIDPWMRVGAQGQNTALFFKIENNSDKADTLYQVDFQLAGKVEIHETYDAGNGMMGMREIGKVIIPANSTFELKPGSFHVMLIKLKQDIKKGFVGDFVLHFRNAGKIKIKAEAQEMMMKMHHKMD
jgi:copper(I)-binding protein